MKINQKESFALAIGGRDLARGKPGALLRATSAAARRSDSSSCRDCGLAIGQCGCGGGSLMAMAPDSSAPGNGLGYSANPSGLPPCTPGCYPRSACDRFGNFRQQSFSEAMRNTNWNGRRPYADPRLDAIEMDTLLSPPTTVAAGATVNIEVTPISGTFVAFYWEIVAVDPATQVQQVDWRAGQPRIEGCPVACGTGDEMALAQLVQKVPEACCGNPLVAYLDRASEDTPLQIPFTNNQAAGDLLVQVRLRGFCCSTRIC
jgi:hypothetical protein